MNLRKLSSLTILAMVFVLAAGAARQAKNARSMLLSYDSTVVGNHLPSGSYNIWWQTHSPEATVCFERRNTLVAIAAGIVVNRGRKYAFNEVVYDEGPGRARVIRELRFQGSNKVIVFNQ